MFIKEHIERIVRVNGLSHDSSDEEIREAIGYAKGLNLNEAIAIFREDKDAIEYLENKKPDFQDNLLAVSGRLRPDSIKRLLGIDLEIDYEKLNIAREGRKSVSIWQIVGIALFSVLFALLAGMFVMKFYEINLFLAFLQM
ncbi:MAG: hypothetical protein WDZ68_00625 [Candidatus Paceibacterota bacterium]